MKHLLHSRLVRLRVKLYVLSFISLGAFAGFVSARPPAAMPAAAANGDADRIMPQFYICSGRNIRVPVTYIQTGGGNAYAVMQLEGRQISMARQAAPDDAAAAKAAPAGPRPPQKYYYLSLNPEIGYRWYPDGDKARLTFLAADAGGKEETVYAACRLRGGSGL